MRKTFTNFKKVAIGLTSISLLFVTALAQAEELKDVKAKKTEKKIKAKIKPALPKIAIPKSKPKRSAKELLTIAMRQRNVQMGNPVFIRIFKKESLLELWMRSGKQFTLLKTYPICKWSGHIGPKLAERDYQSPEGFYTVGRSQMKPNSAYHRAFNIGFPNNYDRAWGRTGSLIMIHGVCRSVGCFAMTNKMVGEIYKITDAALKGGQDKFQVHIFPFKMTAKNIDHYRKHRWVDYWWNLKQGYDMFERRLLPPMVSNKGRHYIFAQAPDPIIRKKEIKTQKTTQIVKKKRQRIRTIKKKDAQAKAPLITENPVRWRPFNNLVE